MPSGVRACLRLGWRNWDRRKRIFSKCAISSLIAGWTPRISESCTCSQVIREYHAFDLKQLLWHSGRFLTSREKHRIEIAQGLERMKSKMDFFSQVAKASCDRPQGAQRL